MSVILLTFLLLLPVRWALAQTPTTCPALRVLTNGTVHRVRCNTGFVEITAPQYNALRLKGAPNPATHCTDGTVNAWAAGFLVWNTPTEVPEPCDVFTIVDKQDVDDATILRVMFNDAYEHEFLVADHGLIWSGPTLLCIDPPIPGLTVETCP